MERSKLRIWATATRPTFAALQIRLDAVAKEFDALPADVRANARARLGRIHVRAHDVGWGSAMLLTNWCTHSTFAQPEQARQGVIDGDREGNWHETTAQA